MGKYKNTGSTSVLVSSQKNSKNCSLNPFVKCNLHQNVTRKGSWWVLSPHEKVSILTDPAPAVFHHPTQLCTRNCRLRPFHPVEWEQGTKVQLSTVSTAAEHFTGKCRWCVMPAIQNKNRKQYKIVQINKYYRIIDSTE